MLELINGVDASRLKDTYRADFKRPYREDPPPRRDLLKRNGSLTTTSLIATRDCEWRRVAEQLYAWGVLVVAVLARLPVDGCGFRVDGMDLPWPTPNA